MTRSAETLWRRYITVTVRSTLYVGTNIGIDSQQLLMPNWYMQYSARIGILFILILPNPSEVNSPAIPVDHLPIRETTKCVC